MDNFNDFYSYINKKWLEEYILPDEHVRFNSFDCLNNEIKKQLIMILNEEMKKKSLIGSICNIVSTKKSTLDDFNQYMIMVDDIKTMNDFANVIGNFSVFGFDILFSFHIGRDFKDSSLHLPCFYQLPLPLITSHYEIYYNEYNDFINNFCKLCNINPTGIYNFEVKLGNLLMTMEDKRDIKNTYNIVEWNDFINLFQCFDFNYYIDCYNFIKPIQSPNVKVDNIDYIRKLSKVISETNIDILKNYTKYKFMISFKNVCLPKNIRELKFDFFSKKISGVLKEKSYDTQLIAYIDDYMDDELGRLYMNKYFSVQKKKYVEKMIELIKISSKNIIKKSWMIDETKEKAIRKINKMIIKVGGPSEIRDYSEFESKLNLSLVEITILFNIYYSKENIMKINSPVKYNIWHMAAYSVNAYYSPQNNEIVIPASLLNEPFFSLSYDLYKNLGSIGSIIAHEISHGFDDQGRLFDEYGNYKTWWSEQDINTYNELIKPIIHQFDSQVILGVNISGRMTIGENIADYSGMTILTNILMCTDASNKSYMTLYSSYAKLWRQKIRDKEMIKRIKTDVHAPPRLRTNVILKNIPKFQSIFKINSNHKMYVDEEDRFKLWNIV